MTIPIGFGEIRWNFAGTGVPLGAQCTLGVNLGGGVDLQALATAAFNAWATGIMPNLVQNTSLVLCEVKAGPDDVGPTAQATGSVGGSLSTSQAPPNLAFLVRKNSNMGGRRGRGRMFIPGVAEADVDQGGNVLPATITALNADLATLKAALITAGALPVILHEPGESFTPVPTEITTMIVQQKAATQRRRMRR